MSVKNIVILGSTGSIGINTLKVVDRFPAEFRVVGLSALNNAGLLAEQVKRFMPACVAIGPGQVADLKELTQGTGVKVFNSETDLPQMVSRSDVDTVVMGISGSAALLPFLTAVRAGKTVATANKEALVIAGEIIIREAKRCGARIIPVDSEQSAIFQCLEGQSRAEVKKVFLTASGGPLRTIPVSRFRRVTVKQILNHPRWKMGKRITVDSATLMNKGFEVIEAKRLFDLRDDEIEVVIHPEAIIHSMVAFRDGSVMAQMGITDMRLPIQYALTYPRRFPSGLKDLDFFRLKKFTFEKPDLRKFPALALAVDVARKGGTHPAVLNAADELAVEAFLQGRISFVHLVGAVEKVVARHKSRKDPGLNDILAADAWARQEAARILTNQMPRALPVA
ncbi:MAG: 1-deoxy-D-xylulose-5-phosphate reductoisomerase [Candidatus Omnitrophota bacterium]|nr:1-deoxy-D-xylulose-5-phosphate reductoisomerase [Candidatus Omnitrophota bacterium]MDZ4241858.1 1-deoxy-D-xylulose-5-phosphate reductoisomerase [Candidatus Omnitrophota bacterium]